MGGSAEHMRTPRRAAPAMWNPQCEEGAGGGAASATWNPHVDVKGGRTRQGRGCGSVDWVEGGGKR